MGKHTIFLSDNKQLSSLQDEIIHLTVTSPPYVTTVFKRGQQFDYEGFLAHFSEVSGADPETNRIRACATL